MHIKFIPCNGGVRSKECLFAFLQVLFFQNVYIITIYNTSVLFPNYSLHRLFFGQYYN